MQVALHLRVDPFYVLWHKFISCGAWSLPVDSLNLLEAPPAPIFNGVLLAHGRIAVLWI